MITRSMCHLGNPSVVSITVQHILDMPTSYFIVINPHYFIISTHIFNLLCTYFGETIFIYNQKINFVHGYNKNNNTMPNEFAWHSKTLTIKLRFICLSVDINEITKASANF